MKDRPNHKKFLEVYRNFLKYTFDAARALRAAYPAMYESTYQQKQEDNFKRLHNDYAHYLAMLMGIEEAYYWLKGEEEYDRVLLPLWNEYNDQYLHEVQND